jgi:antitoxin component of MazEF toxin-antitoxin module
VELTGETVNAVELTRVHKHGNALCVLITKSVREAILWRSGDKIAVRLAGAKVILERVPMEQLAILRTGEATR